MTRSCTPLQLADYLDWLNGSEWLKTKELSGSLERQMPEEFQDEMKASKTKTVHGLLTAVDRVGIGQVMKAERFSSIG